MNIVDYSSNGKTVAANGVATFTNQEIPSGKLTALHFAMTGAGNSFAAISRFRVKANGQTIMDTTPAFLRAWIQSMTNGRIVYPAANSADALGGGTATEFRRFSIPFCDLSKTTREEQDLCGFPRNANITVEFQFNGSAVAGNIFAGFSLSEMEPAFYPKLVSQQMQIAAGATNTRFSFSDEGFIRALGLNSIGLNRLRAVISGMQVFHAQGQATASATFVTDSLAVEAEQLWNRLTDIANATAGVPTTFYNPFVWKINANLPASAGNSFVELATDGTNWAGANNELLIYSQVPQ